MTSMHKPFHDILHPPELQGRERCRYWIAAGGVVCFCSYMPLDVSCSLGWNLNSGRRGGIF